MKQQNAIEENRARESTVQSFTVNQDPISEEQKKEHAQHYKKMFLPTVLYAVIYTICLYDNFGSIMMPVFAVATIVYVRHILKMMEITYQKNSRYYEIAIMLLAVSTATTGNEWMLTLNYAGIFILLICLLFHNFYDDSRWNLRKYVGAAITAVLGAVGTLKEPFADAFCFHKLGERTRSKRAVQILIGIGIAVPFLLLVTALLYSADAVFANLIHIRIDWNFRMDMVIGITCTFVFGFLSAYCGLRYLEKRKIKETCNDTKHFEPVIAIVVLSLTSVVYLLFSGIQIVGLFMGRMTLPAGYTYASYAREGFFQLAVVCVINAAVLLFVNDFFKEHRVLKLLQLIISVCTYIMIASSAYRMILYIRNYDLTFLRVFVLWILAVLAILLGGIVYQIYHRTFRLFRYGLAVVCIAYIGFSFSHPDYYIASYNVNHEMSDGARMDTEYLEGLSSDAAAIIADQQGVWAEEYAERMQMNADTGIRRYNVSRAYAQRVCDR